MNPAVSTELTPEQIERFKRDGFLSIPRLVDEEALNVLRAEYDRFINGEIECGKDNRLFGGLIHQVMYPSRYSAVIRDNQAMRTAKGIATQLSGAPDSSHIRLNFDMMIDKPAGAANATPWHQDFAYSNKPMTPAGTKIPEIAAMQFWLALDDVELDNGCMQFVPGVHVGPLLPHSIVSGNPNDPGRMLAIDHIDSS
jgi:ectoine hydroxylase-related dioxygenase (phytanoyl-CoA dioxygenase family)